MLTDLEEELTMTPRPFASLSRLLRNSWLARRHSITWRRRLGLGSVWVVAAREAVDLPPNTTVVKVSQYWCSDLAGLSPSHWRSPLLVCTARYSAGSCLWPCASGALSMGIKGRFTQWQRGRQCSRANTESHHSVLSHYCPTPNAATPPGVESQIRSNG